MSWRDDPRLPTRWRSFGEFVSTTRPDWEDYIIGAVAAYDPRYGEDDLRFIVEIPSEYPAIVEPLVAELADPEYHGHIDVYWNEFFQHVGGENFLQAIEMLTGIVEEKYLFLIRRDETGMCTHCGLMDAPLERPLSELGAERGGTLNISSWRGTYDEVWPAEQKKGSIT